MNNKIDRNIKKIKSIFKLHDKCIYVTQVIKKKPIQYYNKL